MRAAHRGNRELAQLMIRHGADPSIQTKEGRIAADFAANSGDPALREALLVRADSRQYADLMFGLTRSEEHTSELQSLMRLSYAVFCLKKKNIKIQITKSHTQPNITRQQNLQGDS